MTEVTFEPRKKMCGGKSEWRSPCGRFAAHRLRYLGRWVVYDLAQQDPADGYRILAKGRSRDEVTRKMVDILPTLPPRAQVSFLRADGSVFKSMEMNPNDRDLNEVLRVVGGPGVLACVIPAEARQLVPASTGYIAWYEMRGRWEPCFGMTPAEAMEQAMAWGELGDPPGYGTAQTDSM